MNIPFTIAVNLGLKFKEDDPNCPEDVKTVRDNIRSVKAIQTINAIFSVCMLITAAILDN
jgi:hypothetical protein